MATFRLPLSGNVTQAINPWSWAFNPTGGQYGLINVELGSSENPAAEGAILENVGSYGKQLGRIGDALLVLLDHLERQDASLKRNPAIIALRQQVRAVGKVKDKHPRATA
ncbi:MAG TPA: hypothetical protein VJ487_17835 [Alphaproteobacteria bacterium]|nr:hypothetical protein [Alphaproteobacteria bacterium]